MKKEVFFSMSIPSVLKGGGERKRSPDTRGKEKIRLGRSEGGENTSTPQEPKKGREAALGEEKVFIS